MRSAAVGGGGGCGVARSSQGDYLHEPVRARFLVVGGVLDRSPKLFRVHTACAGTQRPSRPPDPRAGGSQSATTNYRRFGTPCLLESCTSSKCCGITPRGRRVVPSCAGVSALGGRAENGCGCPGGLALGSQGCRGRHRDDGVAAGHRAIGEQHDRASAGWHLQDPGDHPLARQLVCARAFKRGAARRRTPTRSASFFATVHTSSNRVARASGVNQSARGPGASSSSSSSSCGIPHAASGCGGMGLDAGSTASYFRPRAAGLARGARARRSSAGPSAASASTPPRTARYARAPCVNQSRCSSPPAGHAWASEGSAGFPLTAI